jgi:hypothetical protein
MTDVRTEGSEVHEGELIVMLNMTRTSCPGNLCPMTRRVNGASLEFHDVSEANTCASFC